jgi:hypothetical protein
MANPANEHNKSQGGYSATQAPENREHVTSTAQPEQITLKPGGPHGAPFDVGMSGLDPDAVPSHGSTLDLTDHGDNPAADRKHAGRE